MINKPISANAAGKQPTDIAVKCGAILGVEDENGGTYTDSYFTKPDCTIVVTYDDWSTDVAYYSKDGLSGNTQNVQLNGGYKAMTSCTEPSYAWGLISTETNEIRGDSVCLTAGLKTKPINQPTATTVMQMPTTGAPEGLSTAGMIAIGVGLLAVAVAMVKRERI